MKDYSFEAIDKIIIQATDSIGFKTRRTLKGGWFENEYEFKRELKETWAEATENEPNSATATAYFKDGNREPEIIASKIKIVTYQEMTNRALF